MKIYIASSWKNRHAVELLSDKLREYENTEVLSFVENCFEEDLHMDFEEWVKSPAADKSFEYDTNGAMFADLVIYIGPSGTDAWAEVGAAWAKGQPIWGLYAKGEQSGLMRKMVRWFTEWRELVLTIEQMFLLKRRAVEWEVIEPKEGKQ